MKKNILWIFIIIVLLIITFPSLKNKTTSILSSITSHNEASALSTNALTDSEVVAAQIIVIDAGHGGYDSGSIAYDGTLEKEITLSIALKAGALLQKAGYQVVYTRTDDNVSWSSNNLEDLSSRVQIAEEVNAAYFISIHTNASDNYNDGAFGFESYLDYTENTIINMANKIANNLEALHYTQNRGLKSTDENPLYVIDKNCIPSLLLEIGFITDSDDASYMCSDLGQNNLAQAIAQGIIDSL